MKPDEERKRGIRELEKHVDLALMATAFDEAVHHVHHPGGALSTRCALAA